MLDDINQVLTAIKNLQELAQQIQPQIQPRETRNEQERLNASIERVYRLKKAVYEDFKEGLLNREDYLRYKADYEHQEQQLSAQIVQMEPPAEVSQPEHPWIKSLLQYRKLKELDRITVAETVEQI